MLGRKTLNDRPVEWKISLPSSVAGEVILFLTDPLTGNPRHGARARLITELLRGWLSAQKQMRSHPGQITHTLEGDTE